MIVKNADGVSMAIINSYVNVKDSSVLEEENFKDSFNPELFKKTATRVVDMLKNHLDDTQHRGLQLENPKILLEQARELMASHSQDEVLNKEKLNSILDLYMSTGIPVQSNGYMGRQFSSPLPLAGIVDFVSSMINQPSSFYEAAQLPNVAEQLLAEEFYKFIGWNSETATMVTTSGASLGSMTALLAARNNAYPTLWEEGFESISKKYRPAIAVSEEAHYSITRAVGILGIGENQIVKLPVNNKGQIDENQIDKTLDEATARGLNVFCLVAATGSTSLGAFDNINAIGDITQKRNIWLHVDGAHGGGFLVSDKLRYKLKGIEKADSFVLDAHKMLFVPGTCTLLFYKDEAKAYGAFQQKASYVFEEEKDIYTLFDSAEKNFECTKRPMIMNLWVPWAMYGKQVFSQKLDYLYTLTQQAYQCIKKQNDFTECHQPEANIFCFRYTPSNVPILSEYDFQLAIRNAIKEEGNFFISKVKIKGKTALRVVFMNHNIKVQDFEMLLNEIRKVGQQLIKESIYLQ